MNKVATCLFHNQIKLDLEQDKYKTNHYLPSLATDVLPPEPGERHVVSLEHAHRPLAGPGGVHRYTGKPFIIDR